jgi:hypothetical protein
MTLMLPVFYVLSVCSLSCGFNRLPEKISPYSNSGIPLARLGVVLEGPKPSLKPAFPRLESFAFNHENGQNLTLLDSF